jgi:hypothetical protein
MLSRSLRRPPGRYVIYGLSILSLLGQIPLLQRTVRLVGESPANDPVAIADRRLTAVRTALQGIPRAGYVTDIPGDSIGTDAGATERYFLTQYVLVRGTAELFVVGNFDGGNIPRRYGHLRVVRVFDGGLVLFKGDRQ